MKAARCLATAVLLCVLVLSACGPSQEELDATATREAANAAATETAAAPTATPRPTDTPTPRPTDTPTPPAPEAKDLMVDAQVAMSQLESFHMDMDIAASVSQEGVSMEIPIIFAADVDQSGNIQGTMTMSYLGMTIEIEMISLDGMTYMSDPTTGQWSIASEEESLLPFAPEAFVVPEAEESSLGDLSLVSQETLEGVDVYHLQITLPADAFAAGAGEGVDVTDIPAEIWIGVEDGLIYQLTFSGTLPIAGLEELAAGDGDMTMDAIITFSNFNEPVEIVAPEKTAPPAVMSGIQGTQALAFRPNGQILAAGGDDAIVRLWVLADRSVPPAEIAGPTDGIRALAFSPNDRLLAAAGDDQLVWLWDVVTAEVVQLAGHTDWIRTLAFSPDGDILASGGDDTIVLLWDLADLQAEPQQLEGHSDYVRTLAFSPDGATLASGGDDQMVLLWDMNDLAAPPAELDGHEDWVRALAFSPDGATLASGSADTLIYLWNVGDPAARPQALEGHADYVNALAYSPDGGTLASGDDGGALLLWDLNDLTAAPRELAGHNGAIAALAFSPDGRTLASAGSEAVLLWDLTADEPTSTTITPPTFTPKSILVDASRDGGAWWYPQGDTFNPDEPHQGKALADYLRSLGYSVTELSRPTTITSHLLAPFDLVIRANEYGPYTSSEIAAYHGYLEAGGKLLLLSDYKRPNEQDSLGLSFGILFQGISRGENVVDTFEPHPITEGVFPLPYVGGSGISEFPEAADILGYLSAETYLDLNDNGIQDPDEPTQAPALGEMSFGNGKIVFCGETNMWLQVPRPLIDNAVNWLISEPSSAETSANTWYVKSSASGSGDCSSWANACGLQTALLAARAGDEIWVAPSLS